MSIWKFHLHRNDNYFEGYTSSDYKVPQSSNTGGKMKIADYRVRHPTGPDSNW